MAITLADFNKIWASTSPLTPYSFSEANYKQGWNFIGSTPPARQMWDFLQKNNDEKMQYLANNYLPLSGGTMTGILRGNRDSNNFAISNQNSDYGLVLYGYNGSENNGASMYLTGKDAISNAGYFTIKASDGTNKSALIGKPDGTLTWNGTSIPQRSYGFSLSLAEGQNTYTFDVAQNSAVIFAKRGSNASIHMVDYWTVDSVRLGLGGTDPITVTKSAGSSSVTITNTMSGAAVSIKIINGGAL